MNKETVLYTLSHAKSNGSINFVLSRGSSIFCRPPKNIYIFYATHFLYGLEKIFTNKNIFSKGVLHVLFRTFFSKMYNFFFLYSQ